MPGESNIDRDAQLAAEAAIRNQIDQPDSEQLSLFDQTKLLDEHAKAQEAVSHAIDDQNERLDRQTEIRQQHLNLERELAALEQTRATASTKLDELSNKQLAAKLKQLGLEKDIANQIKKGHELSDPQLRARERYKDVAAKGAALEENNMSIEMGQASGFLTPTEAKILSQPDAQTGLAGLLGAHSPVGHMTHHSAFAGLSRFIMDNPGLQAAVLGLSIAHGVANVENEGAAGVFQNIPIIGSTIASIFNEIPGFKAATAFGDTTRLGMVTGGGYRAGLSAQLQAFRMGANPFDIVSNQTATQIVAGARNQGFEGSMARAFEGAMLDVYKQTGIDPATLASIGTLFARQGTGGLDQFRSTMENIDNIARDSSQSVANVTDQIQTLSQALSGTGAAPLGLAGAIVEAVSTVAPQLTPEQQKSLATGFFGPAGMQRFSGFPGATATTPIAQRIYRQNARLFLTAQRQVLQGMPKETQDLMLANLVNEGIFDSVDAARAAIFHGDQIFHRQGVATRRGNARNSFAEAQRAADRMLSTHPGLQLQDFEHEPGRVGTTYVDTLRRNLRSSGFNYRQIQAITAPLMNVLLHPHTMDQQDWTTALGDARKRAIMQSEAGAHQFWSGGAGNQGHMVTFQFDAREMRRLFDGQAVQKRIRLANARDGANTTVGTNFSDGG